MSRKRNQPYIVLFFVTAAIAVAGIWFFRGVPGSFDLEQARVTMRDRDIVVVTLDTTRFDHIGCYGYERDTTPTIDSLAASAFIRLC